MSQTVEPKGDKLMLDKIDVKFKFQGNRKYFEDDDQPRNCYVVTISYKDKHCSFTYGDSIADTEAGLKPKKNDILELIIGDFFLTKENYPTYNDFAPEFGYNSDSIKGLRIYEKVIKQSDKLHKVFDEQDIINLREVLDL